MSTQRRRVLENSGLIIPADGVYIEGLDGKAYTVENWKGGNAANSVIVASGDVKFRIALTKPSSYMKILDGNDTVDTYITAISDRAAAKADYDGAGNTAKILQLKPSTGHAAGYCDAYIFPDGKTKGYLPSLGQLNLAYQNKADIRVALDKCGGNAMDSSDFSWSSTYFGGFKFWLLIWNASGNVAYYNAHTTHPIRPFADIP